jgi:Flp pilus assembly protein TadG
MPVYLILITGMVATVMAISAYQKLSYAVFTATAALGAGETAILNGTGAGDTDPCATVASEVTSSLPGWTAANFTYTIWITENVNGVVSTPQQFGPFTGTAASTCSGVYTTPGNGTYALYNATLEPVKVQVSYVYSWYPIFNRPLSTGTMVVEESTIVN